MTSDNKTFMLILFMAPRTVLLISEDERKEKGNYVYRYDCMLFKNTQDCI